MQTTHKIKFGNANHMDGIESEGIDLVVTSPPYPMIEMWDESFLNQNAEIAVALENKDGNLAFELMHQLLDEVWNEVFRVLRLGGFACINIGDATRTVNNHFQLYSNHARILTHCLKLGFTNLPAIIWRKQTNAPNKFMGSGMLPAGAYVTLEHEFVLILRKGNKRIFGTAQERLNRAKSAIFWEERNVWFSDIWWDLKGRGQELNHDDTRKRSGAFPFELAYRLINMFSAKGHTVLDPFWGTGTTTVAAVASGRNSIGIELDSSLKKAILQSITKNLVENCNKYIRKRIDRHLAFVKERERLKGKHVFKYKNKNYNFPVMTRQETTTLLNYLDSFEKLKGIIKVKYIDKPILDYCEKDSLFASVSS